MPLLSTWHSNCQFPIFLVPFLLRRQRRFMRYRFIIVISDGVTSSVALMIPQNGFLSTGKMHLALLLRLRKTSAIQTTRQLSFKTTMVPRLISGVWAIWLRLASLTSPQVSGHWGTKYVRNLQLWLLAVFANSWVKPQWLRALYSFPHNRTITCPTLLAMNRPPYFYHLHINLLLP